MASGNDIATEHISFSNIPAPAKPVEENMEEFDDLLEFVGSNGKYQKFLLYGSVVPMTSIVALLSFSSIFMLYIPEHHCSPDIEMDAGQLQQWKLKYIPKEIGGDEIGKFSSCKMYNYSLDSTGNDVKTEVDCQFGWTFNKTDYERTIPTDYQWICDKDFYPTNIFTITAIGGFIGNVVFGPLADKYGRKPMFFISLVIYLVFVSISFAIPHHFIGYSIVTFLAATGFPMIYTIPALIMAELCDNKYRAWTFTAGWVAWDFGMMFVPYVAYISRTWLTLGLAVTLPAFLLFLIFPLLPESPRWLIATGKVDEAVVIMSRIAEINGTSTKITDEEMTKSIKKLVDLEKEKEQTLGFWTLFSTRRLALITSLISIAWTGNSMIYEQITLNAPYMSGNQFLNFFILAAVEMPGSCLGGLLIAHLGRRWTPVLFGVIMAGFCLAAGAGPQDNTIFIITCIILAKFSVTVTFYVVYLQATELFPTPLRVTGNAVAMTIASVVGLVNPAVVYTAKYYSGSPYLVMFLISLIVAACSSFLPETLRQRLPETIEDAEDFGKGNKYWSIHPDYDRKRRKSLRRESVIQQGNNTTFI